MSTVIYGTDSDELLWGYRDDTGGDILGTQSETYNPYPVPGAVEATYLNKCVDGVTNEWVFWETFFQDRNGTRYPGQSFDSATYKVETIVYQREQI